MFRRVDHDFTMNPAEPAVSRLCSWRMNDSKNDQSAARVPRTRSEGPRAPGREERMKPSSSFIAITTEGGLLPADFLVELLAPQDCH